MYHAAHGVASSVLVPVLPKSHSSLNSLSAESPYGGSSIVHAVGVGGPESESRVSWGTSHSLARTSISSHLPRNSASPQTLNSALDVPATAAAAT